MFLSLVKIFLLATEEFHWSLSLSFLKTLLQCKSSQFKKAQMPQARKEKSLPIKQGYQVMIKSTGTTTKSTSCRLLDVTFLKFMELMVLGQQTLHVHILVS